MNKIRRKQLESIAARLEELRAELEDVMADEAEYRDNIPENLQGSERYEKADEACDNLSYALDAFEEAVGYIESAAE